MMMPDTDLAYLAGIVDTLAVLRTRQVTTMDAVTVLPMVAVHTPDRSVLRQLTQATGTKVTETNRAYAKAGCSQHCRERHQHVRSTSYRWSVTGVKATILLVGVRPYLRVKGAVADDGIRVGLQAPRKSATVVKMHALGWPLPVGWELPHER